MTDAANLARLSAAATEGALIHHGWGDGSTVQGMTNIFNEDAEVLLMECIPVGDAAFIVALWNLYRSGRLVLLPSVETLREYITEAWDADEAATAIHNQLKGTGDAN